MQKTCGLNLGDWQTVAALGRVTESYAASPAWTDWMIGYVFYNRRPGAATARQELW